MLEYCIKELHMLGYCRVQVSQYPTPLDKKQLEVKEWSNDHWMFSSASLENIRNERVLLEKLFTGNSTYSWEFQRMYLPSLGSLTYVRHNPGMFN